MGDNSLLREFAACRSEAAFAALVRQHVNLVFATAYRQLGNHSLAEEVTQSVFVALARKAGSLGPSDYPFERLSLRDCWLRGAYFCECPNTGSSVTISLVNNLVERCDLYFHHYYGSLNTPLSVQLYNNLFRRGGFLLRYYSGSVSPVWELHDNLFDGTSLTCSGDANWDTYINQSHNGFTGSAAPLNGSNNKEYVTANYQAGPLGTYYYPTTGGANTLVSLINAGSRTAADAGLYHHTVRADNVKEGEDTPATVDSGYHYPAAANVARNQTATQSTTAFSGDASRAVDGNPDGNWSNNSVTHTDLNTEAWWQVDLGAVRPVEWINIWNRTDCCGDRLANFYVFVSENPFQSTSVQATLQQAGVRTFYFAGPAPTLTSFSVRQSGRYIRVQLTGQNYLSLAEVQVFTGEAVDTDSDGLADYAEDRDGDNVVDSGETKLNDPDTDYDGRSDAQELAEATNPLDAASATPLRLGFWRFNDANWSGDQGQLPKVTPVGVQRVPSWRTNALQVKNSAGAANLKYRDVEANGSANINCQKGTVRFWFKPAWASSSQGGSGPVNTARLLEMGNSGTSEGWWALSVNGTGTEMSLTTRTNGGQPVVVLTRTVSWPTDEWRQIALTYSPTTSALYVDAGQLGTNGPGLTSYPNATTRAAYGFSIGSNQAGGEQAMGQFEELETFNYPLSEPDISANFVATTNSAAPFAMGVYGDLQWLADTAHGGSQAKYTFAIATLTNWIGGSTNLKVALCSGDLQDSDLADQWAIARTAWSMLSNRCLTVIAPGNHDESHWPNDYDTFRDNFSWITNVPGVFGGSYPDSYHIQNAYWRTNISGLPFLFLTLQYMPTLNANLITWAQGVLDSHPDDLVVIVTHNYLWPQPRPEPPQPQTPWVMVRVSDGQNGDSQQLWDQLIHPRPNVWMVLGGHFGAVGNARFVVNPETRQRDVNSYGRFVNELYLDYSGCWAGEPVGKPPYGPYCCDPNCIGWWHDGRSSAVARLIKVDPLKNSVTVDHWSCESEPPGGFWLTNLLVPYWEEDQELQLLTEGTYAFPLFD